MNLEENITKQRTKKEVSEVLIALRDRHVRNAFDEGTIENIRYKDFTFIDGLNLAISTIKNTR